MATHLTEIKGGERTYYISHSGDTVYYSTAGRGKGSTRIRGLKFRNNQIIDTNTNKPVGSDYEILKKMGK